MLCASSIWLFNMLLIVLLHFQGLIEQFMVSLDLFRCSSIEGFGIWVLGVGSQK